MKITEYLNTLNQKQKITLGLLISLSILLFLAHNPLSGYITDQEHKWDGYSEIEGTPLPYVPQPENWESITPLPFHLWRTNYPLLAWLGNVVNFIYSLVAVISIGAIFIGFVFSNNTNQEPK
jgi:hypothetical protein